MREKDTTLYDLQKEVKKPTHNARERAAFLEANWRLEDHKSTLRLNHPVYQQGPQTSSRRFQAALQEDRRWRVSTTGVKIEALLAEG